MISNSVDGQRCQHLTADLGLRRVEPVAPAVDAERERGAAAGLLHGHIDERRVVFLARVISPRRPQAAGQQRERGEPGEQDFVLRRPFFRRVFHSRRFPEWRPNSAGPALWNGGTPEETTARGLTRRPR